MRFTRKILCLTKRNLSIPHSSQFHANKEWKDKKEEVSKNEIFFEHQVDESNPVSTRGAYALWKAFFDEE